MLTHIKNRFLIASTNPQFKIAIQIFFLVIMLVAALAQSDAALASPSWGDIGG